MFKDVFLLAAQNGIVEIVEELAETFPDILWEKNDDDQNIFHVAVLFRHRRVYNLAYRIAKVKRDKSRDPDKHGNNILHMAGKLAPLHRLNLISGAASKMRYELQWFEVCILFLSVTSRGFFHLLSCFLLFWLLSFITGGWEINSSIPKRCT